MVYVAWITRYRRDCQCVADGRNSCAAPLADPVVLRDLFRNIVAENGELASEVVVNSSDLFLQIVGECCHR